MPAGVFFGVLFIVERDWVGTGLQFNVALLRRVGAFLPGAFPSECLAEVLRSRCPCISKCYFVALLLYLFMTGGSVRGLLARLMHAVLCCIATILYLEPDLAVGVQSLGAVISGI